MEAKRKAYINDLVIRKHNGMIKVVPGVKVLVRNEGLGTAV